MNITELTKHSDDISKLVNTWLRNRKEGKYTNQQEDLLDILTYYLKQQELFNLAVIGYIAQLAEEVEEV